MAVHSFVPCNHETLISNSTIFCAQILKKEARRCGKTVNKKNIPELKGLLEDINKVVLSDDQSRETLQQLLQKIGRLSLCGQHHQKYVDDAVEQWLRDFTNGFSAQLLEEHGSQSGAITEIATTAAATIMTRDRTTTIWTRSMGPQISNRSSRPSVPNEREVLAFVPFHQRTKSRAEVDQEVIATMHQGIGRQADDQGYIYLFSISRNPGFHKIGKSKDPDKRFERQKRCFGGLSRRPRLSSAPRSW